MKSLSRWVMMAIVVFGIYVGSMGTNAFAIWPFSSPKEEKNYLAKVGDEVITEETFLGEVKKLHTSNRVGRALSERKDFPRVDFRGYLEEYIENKLMVVEARRLGLDNDPEFKSSFHAYSLNIYLSRLREDEVIKKVSVSEEEIVDYYRKVIQKGHDKKEKEAKDRDVKEEGKDDAGKKDTEKIDIPPDMRKRIVFALRRDSIREREKEFFETLRKKASVKIDEKLVDGLSDDKPELFAKPVAVVNGESIPGISLYQELKNVKRDNMDDKELKRKILDKLILHKLLDQEAMKRGYDSEKEVKAKIEKIEDDLLIKIFKKRIILPSIKVTDEEIKEYYEKNKENYRKPDEVKMRSIMVLEKEEAESLFEKLKKGADFAYLARKYSDNKLLRRTGGEMGWVPVNQISKEMRAAVTEAKEGDILGPFFEKPNYIIIEFQGYKKGEYIPLKDVRMEIDRIIGNKKFKASLREYLERLKKVVPIVINEKKLEAINANYR